MVSFVLNVAHAEAGDWPARGVAAIPPAALVLSVELLVLIARRAALARTHRLTTATRIDGATSTEVVWGDQATTGMVAPSGGRPALEATSGTGNRPRAATSTADDQAGATGDQSLATTAATVTSAKATSGATYQRVQELYLGGMTVAAHIVRELGISASYAQRTLRRVKADLDRQQDMPATDAGRATTLERTTEATSDHQQPGDGQPPKAERSPDHPTTPDSKAREATRNGDGRPSGDRRLVLVAAKRDRGEVER